jgi:hypothetical protein
MFVSHSTLVWIVLVAINGVMGDTMDVCAFNGTIMNKLPGLFLIGDTLYFGNTTYHYRANIKDKVWKFDTGAGIGSLFTDCKRFNESLDTTVH